MNKRSDIAIACFIGGSVCATTLICTPSFWLLGIIAGFASGYLSYRFGDTLRAIPMAWNSTKSYFHSQIKPGLAEVARIMKSELVEEGPIIHYSIVVSIPLVIAFNIFLFLPGFISVNDAGGLSSYIITTLFLSVFGSLALLAVPYITLFFLTFLGSRSENCFFPEFADLLDIGKEKIITRLVKKGYKEKPLTYANCKRWLMKGLREAFLFFLYGVYVIVAYSLWVAFVSIMIFIYSIIRLIHSNERVLCAIDGTLGGIVSYSCFATSITSTPNQIVCVLFGGIMGMVIGVFNWEIVSVRLLKIPVK